MKTLILFLLAGVTANASLQQKEILFKQEIKPEIQYTWSVASVTTSTMDVSGSAEEIQKLTAPGQTFPAVCESSSEEIRILKTGLMNADNSFPAILTYIKSSEIIVENGKRTVSRKPIQRTSIIGVFDSKNKFNVITAKDSSKRNLPKRELQAFKANYDKLQKNLEIFPDSPLKTGESFDHKDKVRIQFPGCKNPVVITIISNYRLKNIDNNVAEFDVTKTVGLYATPKKGNVKASGKSTGIMEFDISTSHIIKEETNDEMAITLNVSGLEMTGTFKTKSNQQIKIE
jgi:hypothetical protein